MSTSNRTSVIAVGFILLFSCSCTSLYYASMNKLGKEKRDILVKRIGEGKKDQEEAREQIKTTLEAFKELTGFDGGDLEKVYGKLNNKYESAKDRANDVSNKIKSIDRVAKDMFREWEGEINQMKDPSFKTRSRSLLRDAQLQHKQYMNAMNTTDTKMKSVVQAFNDQVLFLKHNLNARAIRSLKTTTANLDRQVESLLIDIDKSMKESEVVVKSLLAAPTES